MTLTLTQHAESRMHERKFTAAYILYLIRKCERAPIGRNVLHYSLRDKRAVLVDWRTEQVITVMHLNDRMCWQLRSTKRLEVAVTP